MSLRRTTTGHAATCPDCSAPLVNVQGIRVCERCSWDAGRD